MANTEETIKKAEKNISCDLLNDNIDLNTKKEFLTDCSSNDSIEIDFEEINKEISKELNFNSFNSKKGKF